MSKVHMLIDANEASSVIIKFIGSDRYNEIINAIEDTAQAGFTTGLSFALCLMMAECKTKFFAEEEDTLNE